jgi:Arc/MetJ family transcription regulator
MPTLRPRIQVTVDDELDAALRELGGGKSRSRAVHDLALRGAQAMRQEQQGRRRAIEHLLRIANGEDDRYDFSVSERLHAER